MPSFLRQGLSLKLEFSILAKLTWQGAPRIRLSLPPQCWGDTSDIYVGAGDLNWGLHAPTVGILPTEHLPNPTVRNTDLKCMLLTRTMSSISLYMHWSLCHTCHWVSLGKCVLPGGELTPITQEHIRGSIQSQDLKRHHSVAPVLIIS